MTVAAIGVAGLTNTLLNVTRPGGRVNLFAGYSGTGETTLEANLIHYGELVVTGTNACTREDFRIALDLLASGQFKAGPLVSHRFPLEQIEAAFETTRSGEGLRVVVEPPDLTLTRLDRRLPIEPVEPRRSP